MTAAVSAMLAASFAEHVLYGSRVVSSVILPMMGFIAAEMVVLIAPLLVFAPRLFEVKQRGLLEYGVLAENYTRAFDAKWVHAKKPPDEPLLGSADLQSLADLANAFAVIRNMRLAPLSPAQAVALFLSAALPATPLVLLVVPFDELVVDALRMLVGI